MAGAEVLVEGGGVEVGEGPVPGQAVDIRRLEAGVGDRPLGRLGADLAGGAPGRLRVRALSHAGDGRASGNVVQIGTVAPVRPLSPHEQSMYLTPCQADVGDLRVLGRWNICA